jgi:hypothetical protein
MLKRIAIALCCGVLGYIAAFATVFYAHPAYDCTERHCAGLVVIDAFLAAPWFAGIGFLLAILLTRRKP